MRTNEAVVFEAPGEVSVRETDAPSPGPEEVLVETERTLISTGTELTILSGDVEPDSDWDDIAEYPFFPGYNNVGTVVETGSDVEESAVGRRVATTGGHRAYTVAAADDCRPVPDEVSADEAAFFTIAEIVMNGVRRADLTWGESVVVYGLGLLGQLATRLCRVAGARPVIGVDLASSRLDYLPDRPGISSVHPDETPPADALEDAAGRLADVVFEVTGNPDAIPTELETLRRQGRFVVLSSPRGETSFDFHDHCNAPSYRIVGAHNSSHPDVATPSNPWTQARHAELFFEYLVDGSLSVESLVSHRRRYADAPALYEMLLEDRSDAMGVVLTW